MEEEVKSIEEETKLCIIVISEDNNLKKIKSTVNNLKANGCLETEYVIAIDKENEENIKDSESNEDEESEENIEDSENNEGEENQENMEDNLTAKEFCEENGINYYEYENLEDVYYELPKTLEFDYISFINSGDRYTKNFKTKMKKHFGKRTIDVFVCPIMYKKVKYVLNQNIAKGKRVAIEKSPSRIWIHLNSVFMSKNILSRIEKPKTNNLKYYIDKNLLMKLIILSGDYKIIRNVKLRSGKILEDSKESKIENYDISWYENLFNNAKDVFEFSIREHGSILRYVQYATMYLIKNVINENVNSKNKHILASEKLDKFYEKLKDILQNIDNKIIMNTLGNKLVNFYLLRLKCDLLDKDIEYREFSNRIYVADKSDIILNVVDTKIKILLMDYIDGNLVITATYPIPFDEKKLRIYAEYLDNKIYAEKNDLYSEYRAFGKKVYENYAFDIKIPLEINEQKRYIKFFVETDKSNVRLDISFNKPLSRLSILKHAYWVCGKFILNYRKKGILVMQNSKLRQLKREYKYIKSHLRSKSKIRREAGKLRIIYHLTKPFYKKEIWLFEDKIYKGGDNGEYLYNYAIKQKDGIKKYYVLKDGCVDAERFKKEHKKYVKFGTLRHRLLFLNSTIVFQTHNNVTKQHGFDEKIEKYFRDLYNSQNVCIQHGLTVQYIPNLENRIGDNLKQYFLASPVEKKNMENKEYAYKGYEDFLKITGSPRYDGLKNNDKKQILITPTWRNYLALPSPGYGKSRRHNNDFKQSEYFKIYNELINNQKLIECANKYGYKIIYLLHPCTSVQIDDYDKNEFVELIAATDDLNYEKILTESSLMVTDYSGVQFDFAYMYKPVVYFHPNELPPSYEEGEYKYETMALGDIVKTNDELVNLLCTYMKNECKIKEEYKERIDKFFKYHDDNNCKRIYDEIMKFRRENNGE